MVVLHMPQVLLRSHPDHLFQRLDDFLLVHRPVAHGHLAALNAPGRLHNHRLALWNLDTIGVKVIDLAHAFKTYSDYLDHEKLLSPTAGIPGGSF